MISQIGSSLITTISTRVDPSTGGPVGRLFVIGLTLFIESIPFIGYLLRP
jgi:hypothetical protein